MRYTAVFLLSALTACRPAGESPPEASTPAGSAESVPSVSPTPDPIPPETASALSVPDSARTFVYECGDRFEFTARVAADTTWVYSGGQVIRLPQTWSASGTRYSDGRNAFWSKDEEALLELEGRVHGSCRNNVRRAIWQHATLTGVDFRAVGQEPGWLLEIDDGNRITMLADYGERRVVTPAPAPRINPATKEKIYQVATQANRLTVVIRNQPCQDVMSGEPYPATVLVTLDGQQYQGCGKALR